MHARHYPESVGALTPILDESALLGKERIAARQIRRCVRRGIFCLEEFHDVGLVRRKVTDLFAV